MFSESFIYDLFKVFLIGSFKYEVQHVLKTGFGSFKYEVQHVLKTGETLRTEF
jgi:hypothetical protein